MAINPNDLPELDVAGLEADLQKQQQYGDRPVEAFTGEALNTATFGLSDVALRTAGVSPERLSGVREVNPGAATAGTAAGIIVPTIASFGTAAPIEAAGVLKTLQKGAAASMPESVAKVLAAPLKGVSVVGDAAEHLVAAGLPTGTAKTIAGAIARGAAEGGAIGTGQGIGEMARDERELAAESLLNAAGAGALFGGAFGAVVGGIETAAKGSKAVAPQAIKNVSQSAMEVVENTLDPNYQAIKMTGGGIAKQQMLDERFGDGALADYFIKDLRHGQFETAKTLSAKNKLDLQQAREEISNVLSKVDEHIKTNGSPATREEVFQQLLDELEQQRKAVINTGSGKETLNQIKEFTNEITALRDKAIRTAVLPPEKIAQIAVEQSKLGQELQEVASAFNERKPALRADKRLEKLSAEMDGLAQAQLDAEKVFAATAKKQQAKNLQLIDSLSRKQENVVKQLELTNSQINTAKPGSAKLDQLNRRKLILEAQQKDLNANISRLKEPKIEGPEAIKQQQKIEKLRARQAEVAAESESLRTAREEAQKLASRQTELQQKITQLEIQKIAENVTPAPFDIKELDTLRKRYQDFKYPSPGFNDGGSASQKAQIAGKLRATIRKQLDDIASGIDPELGIKLSEANRRYHIGSAVEDPLARTALKTPDLMGTSLFGFAASTGARLARNFIFVNNVGQKVQTIRQAVSDAVKGAFTGKGPAKILHTPLINTYINSGFAIIEPGKKPKTQLQAFNNIKENLNKAQVDPEGFIDLLVKKTAKVAAASPDTAMALQQRLATAVQFLNSKMPKASIENGMFARAYQPSSMEMAKFGRYLQVVEQPMSALEELKAGTLTREHVEALQAVAPAIYKLIQQETIQYMSTPEAQKLPYAKKLQLGIMLNVPADSALQPKALLQLQQSINVEPEQAKPGPQLRAAAMEKSGISERAESGTEKLTNR